MTIKLLVTKPNINFKSTGLSCYLWFGFNYWSLVITITRTLDEKIYLHDVQLSKDIYIKTKTHLLLITL